MKSRIFMAMVACLFTYSVAQAQVFVIERGSNTLTYSNIKAAVDALQDNDKLYLPPGEYSLSGYKWEGYAGTQNYSNILVVNKKVSIYGGGAMNGANSTTLKDGTFVIGKDANGSFITGIRFDHYFELDNVSNCVVTRCITNYYIHLYGKGSNNVITECEFKYYVDGNGSGYLSGVGSGLSCIFSKCIFENGYSTFRNSSVYNCIFNSLYSVSFYNCTLNNNIFILNRSVTNTQYTVIGTNNTYSNNLWVGGYPTVAYASDNNSFNNEIERESYANVFINADSGDYHLKAECSGKNAGSDGTDVGIYGTSVPFKEDRLPLIPNFKLKVISPETDATGKLPVNIVVEAQDR